MKIIKVRPDTAQTCIQVQRVNTDCTNFVDGREWKLRITRVYCPPRHRLRRDCAPPKINPCGAGGPLTVPDRYDTLGPDCALEDFVPSSSTECVPEFDHRRTIEYPVFDTDEQGRLCFYWDDLLLKQKPGRYNAELVTAKGRLVLKFQIDLRGETADIALGDAATVCKSPCHD